MTPCVAGAWSAPAIGGPSCWRFGGSRWPMAWPTLTFAYSVLIVYAASDDCTCGSWMIWVVAFVQALLSSICRFTHVVRIETSMRTDARTTSTQTRMRRPRVSEAGALAAAGCFGSLAAGSADGVATPAASRRDPRAASSHPGDTGRWQRLSPQPAEARSSPREAVPERRSCGAAPACGSRSGRPRRALTGCRSATDGGSGRSCAGSG